MRSAAPCASSIFICATTTPHSEIRDPARQADCTAIAPSRSRPADTPRTDTCAESRLPCTPGCDATKREQTDEKNIPLLMKRDGAFASKLNSFRANEITEGLPRGVPKASQAYPWSCCRDRRTDSSPSPSVPLYPRHHRATNPRYPDGSRAHRRL